MHNLNQNKAMLTLASLNSYNIDVPKGFSMTVRNNFCSITITLLEMNKTALDILKTRLRLLSSSLLDDLQTDKEFSDYFVADCVRHYQRTVVCDALNQFLVKRADNILCFVCKHHQEIVFNCDNDVILIEVSPHAPFQSDIPNMSAFQVFDAMYDKCPSIVFDECGARCGTNNTTFMNTGIIVKDRLL